ncbi:uncharacterized protein PV06_07603 [Exophiala oligosperma]|uniref:DNA replication factor Cdt1 C-terminal domain-containing protein n=2 Tax=Chaetothyriales TaxID=34395 RepID=A0A0D2DXY2_9EURO|nr:uncharacterized protein PV06_07603 [Exophiala oligosperma]KAJ9625371.1 hypothetical protein H2204_010464 [Knufia peltigerae]KIW40399.1 hypothetical protein PV06_07603 [Exophiala oligosperma]
MAPSSRNSHRVSKRQTLQNYTKISKSTRSKTQLEAVVKEVSLGQVVSQKKVVKSSSKRKREFDESDTEADSLPRVAATTTKKTKLQLATPPESEREDSIDVDPCIDFCQLSLNPRCAARQHGNDDLPPVLRDFVSMHDAFLRAFSLHRVHNGRSAPADLGSLLTSVTRLWKKRAVTQDDIQRMLAIYELDASSDVISGQLLRHQDSPFRLNLNGSDVLRYSVEYVQPNQEYDEKNLQQSYEVEIEAVAISQRQNLSGLLSKDGHALPRLEFSVGLQTQARKAKASAARREILGLSTQAQNRPGSQFSSHASSSSGGNDLQTPQVVKDRTLSLLDRVRAKALANSSAAPPSPEAILRRRAIGRIGEVVDILRLKQQQKLGSRFDSSVHSSPGKVRGKVSFSLKQLVGDIKGSMAIPMADSEVRKCFEVLAQELPGMWLSIHTVGILQSVVLNGPGPSGTEAKRVLEEKEKAGR